MTKRALAGAVRRSIAAPRARAPSAAFSSRAGIHAVDLESDPTLAAPRGSGSSMSPLASLRMAQTEPSVFAEFSDLAEKYNAVNLGQGYPNFPIPDFVKEAGAAAIHADHNQYTRPAGHPQLVSQLAQYYSPLLGRELDAQSEVCVVGGATNAIFSAVMALVDPGDEVVCIEPYFDAPKIAADLMGAKTIGVPLRADWATAASDWTLDLAELDAALSDRTKLLVLNTPHNPTGKVFSREELEGIAALVHKYPKLVVMSDEVYEFMVFDDLKHERISALPGMFDRTLSVHSAGKTFSATGWRIGYVIGPAPLITPLVRVHQASNFCTPTSLQVATAAAFAKAEEDNYFDEFAIFLQRKRDKLVALLRTAQLDPIVPQGGYFLLADTTKISVPSEFPLWEAPEDTPLAERRDFSVCRLLTEKAGVTALPASAFFSPPHRHITDSLARFCFCKTDDTLEAAFKRIIHSGLSKAWI